MNISYQRPWNPHVWLAGVVSYGVDHPSDEPNEAKGRGHLGVKQTGTQENGQEDGDALKGVLVNSLNWILIVNLAKVLTE